jgi:hypothetical protein
MQVYEEVIEIWLSPAFDDASKHHDAVEKELRRVRELYLEPE